MIRNFLDKATQDIFDGEFSTKSARKLPGQIHRRAQMLLLVMNRAKSLKDLCIPPSNRLENLKGNRKKESSVRINDQWRITFKFDGSDFLDVLVEDYH